MARIKNYTAKYLKSEFENIYVYTFLIKVKDLLDIYYVARRGVDNEDGAVQRVLNKSRINSIRDFILSGKSFFNTFIINWTNNEKRPLIDANKIEIPIVSLSAQVIDGQHRLSGLFEACKIDSKIGKRKVTVSMCIGLSTKEASSIFLNINSEQKPVPRSLVYDLFGIVDDNKNLPINRAHDIATELHENKTSPYYDLVKFPGKTGDIDLASVIGALKKHLDVNGVLAKKGLKNLENQKKIILNYFIALSYEYKKENIWNNKNKNPFLTSAGFYGAIEALIVTFLPKCIDKRSFTVKVFQELLGLDSQKLLLKEELKIIERKSRRKEIQRYLETNLQANVLNENEYEFE